MMQNFPTELFRCPPLVGRVTGTRAVVGLVSAVELAEPVSVTLVVRGPGLPLVSIASCETPNTPLTIVLRGLRAGETYTYRLRWRTTGRWQTDATARRLHTQPVVGTPFRAAFISDEHWGQPNAAIGLSTPRGLEARRCMQILAAEDPALAFSLGDSAHMGGVHSLAAAESRYEAMRAGIEPLSDRGMFNLVLGNHECEAGFTRNGGEVPVQPANNLLAGDYVQLWSTAARRAFLLNPLGTTYGPLGGEGAPGYDSWEDWCGAAGPWRPADPESNLGNFWSLPWGDALFIALDPYRYTCIDAPRLPHDPAEWALGATQLRWLQDVLAAATQTWKIILLHHLVGGTMMDEQGVLHAPGGDYPAYARGNANDATYPSTTHAWLHELCVQHGVRLVLYGHNHLFCHSIRDDVHYVECPRPGWGNAYYHNDGFLASYGSLLEGGAGTVELLRNVLGGLILDVDPGSLLVRVLRTGWSRYKEGERDWHECWAGQGYDATPTYTDIECVPRAIDAVRTGAGAAIGDFYGIPTGADYWDGDLPATTRVGLTEFPESTAVVDSVPEVVDEFVIA